MVLTSRQYHRQVLIPHFELRPPNVDGKPMVSVDELRVILVFNIAYDQSIFPGERHRIHLAGCYLLLSYTGARPAELVYSERKKPKDGTVAELFGSKVVMRTDGGGDLDLDEPQGKPVDTAPDEASRRLDELLLAETVGRGRPKALCYEDIMLMIVKHPVTDRPTPVMVIKFIHYKGSDNRPKPYVHLLVSLSTM